MERKTPLTDEVHARVLAKPNLKWGEQDYIEMMHHARELEEHLRTLLEEAAKEAGNHVNRITGSEEYWKGRHDAELAVRGMALWKKLKS